MSNQAVKGYYSTHLVHNSKENIIPSNNHPISSDKSNSESPLPSSNNEELEPVTYSNNTLINRSNNININNTNNIAISNEGRLKSNIKQTTNPLYYPQCYLSQSSHSELSTVSDHYMPNDRIDHLYQQSLQIPKQSIYLSSSAPNENTGNINSHNSFNNFMKISLANDCNAVLGCIEINSTTTLAQLRELIVNELDDVPTEFRFIVNDITVGKNQESKRLAVNYLPKIGIKETKSSNKITVAEPSLSDASTYTISALFSIPLLQMNEFQQFIPSPVIDFQQECDMICKTIEESKKIINLTLDFATTDTLQSVLTRGNTILHYSGHCDKSRLVLENGFTGAAHFLDTKHLQSLVSIIPPANLPKLFLINACDSRSCAEILLNCGISHVIAIENNREITDSAAIIFTRAFYKAIMQGLSVQIGFNLATEAVRISPNSNSIEQAKFVLLPVNSDVHNQILFPAVKSCNNWIRPVLSSNNNLNLRSHFELFFGRAIDQFRVLNLLQHNKLVSIIAKEGMGKTALAIASATYLQQRNAFKDGVFFFALSDKYTISAVLTEFKTVLNMDTIQSDNLSINSIVNVFKSHTSLLVLDSPEFGTVPEIQAFIMRLLQQARNCKILITSTVQFKSTHSPTMINITEKLLELQPLSLLDAAKLVIKSSPRIIQSAELACRNHKELLEKLVTSNYSKYLDTIPGKIVESAVLLRNMDLITFLQRDRTQSSSSSSNSSSDTDSDNDSLIITNRVAGAAGAVTERQPIVNNTSNDTNNNTAMNLWINETMKKPTKPKKYLTLNPNLSPSNNTPIPHRRTTQPQPNRILANRTQYPVISTTVPQTAHNGGNQQQHQQQQQQQQTVIPVSDNGNRSSELDRTRRINPNTNNRSSPQFTDKSDSKYN